MNEPDRTAPILPDTFIERAVAVATSQADPKDAVVGLTASEASFIRRKFMERNRPLTTNWRAEYVRLLEVVDTHPDGAAIRLIASRKSEPL